MEDQSWGYKKRSQVRGKIKIWPLRHLYNQLLQKDFSWNFTLEFMEVLIIKPGQSPHSQTGERGKWHSSHRSLNGVSGIVWFRAWNLQNNKTPQTECPYPVYLIQAIGKPQYQFPSSLYKEMHKSQGHLLTLTSCNDTGSQAASAAHFLQVWWICAQCAWTQNMQSAEQLLLPKSVWGLQQTIPNAWTFSFPLTWWRANSPGTI